MVSSMALFTDGGSGYSVIFLEGNLAVFICATDIYKDPTMFLAPCLVLGIPLKF